MPMASLASTRAAHLAVSGQQSCSASEQRAACCATTTYEYNWCVAHAGELYPPSGTKQVCCAPGTSGYTTSYGEYKCCDDGGCKTCKRSRLRPDMCVPSVELCRMQPCCKEHNQKPSCLPPSDLLVSGKCCSSTAGEHLSPLSCTSDMVTKGVAWFWWRDNGTC